MNLFSTLLIVATTGGMIVVVTAAAVVVIAVAMTTEGKWTCGSLDEVSAKGLVSNISFFLSGYGGRGGEI